MALESGFDSCGSSDTFAIFSDRVPATRKRLYNPVHHQQIAPSSDSSSLTAASDFQPLLDPAIVVAITQADPVTSAGDPLVSDLCCHAVQSSTAHAVTDTSVVIARMMASLVPGLFDSDSSADAQAQSLLDSPLQDQIAQLRKSESDTAR